MIEKLLNADNRFDSWSRKRHGLLCLKNNLALICICGISAYLHLQSTPEL